MGSLIGKMNLCFLDTSATDQTFYIYPNNDNTDVWVMSDSTTVMPSGCDKSSSPDGSQQTLDTEPPLPAPNFATEEFDCYGSYTFPTVALLHGDRKWTPGTGYSGGCLGELTIQRTTDVYLGGVCPCP